jgi:hypothetical protein
MRARECYDQGSSIQEKVHQARALHRKWGEKFRQQPQVANLLEELRDNIGATWRTMDELGVVETCRSCDAGEGGSCCGAGIDNKFDALLLFINLVFGVSLPDYRRRHGCCYFLTETGCSLKVRLFLCVDYLCPKILERLHHEELIRLQKVSGAELIAAFLVYDAVKKFLRDGHTL